MDLNTALNEASPHHQFGSEPIAASYCCSIFFAERVRSQARAAIARVRFALDARFPQRHISNVLQGNRNGTFVNIHEESCRRKMKKRIIICGYPKSGNTWLTRLTAEILRCPVIGFWCQPSNHDEESIEGLDRESEFECFKSHHNFEQMARTLVRCGNGTEKIIYIYRDPRSVLASASHYFRFNPRYPHLHKFLGFFPKGVKLYFKFMQSYSYKLDIMTKALVDGTSQGAWLKTPWKDHIAGYKGKDGILMLSYEALKADTLSAARQISGFLSIQRSDEELEEAIRKQSFARKKELFLSEGKNDKANFLRKGKSDSWREEIPEKNLMYIEREIGEFMEQLGYRVSSEI